VTALFQELPAGTPSAV